MKEWLNQVVEICITEMPFEHKKELIQRKQNEFAQFDEYTQNVIHELFRDGFEPRDSVYILSVFQACISESVWTRDLLKCILREDNYTYEESIMMEYQLKAMQLGCYAERKMLRRKTDEKLKRLGLYSENYIPLACRNSNRIVMITEQILGVNHSPTLVVYNSIYYLQQLGYEVMLFACPSDACLEENIWYRCVGASSIRGIHGMTGVDTFRGQDIYIYQVNLCEKDCIEKYRAMIELIREWNPLFVYQIGLVNAIGDMLTGVTTVVSEMLSINDCSVSNAQIIIRAEENDKDIEDEISQNMECYQTQLWKKGHIPIFNEKADIVLTREQLNLPENEFLIAVVGNRLDMECGSAFIDLLRKVIRVNSMVGVVFIGETDNLKNLFSETENVYFIGYQKNLQNVYSILDLYVNPERAGGGYSSQMALQEGLPVVTLPKGDVAHVAGDEFIVADYEEMYSMIEKYMRDKAFMKLRQEYAKKRGQDNAEDSDYMGRKIAAIKNIIQDQENGISCSRYTMANEEY